MVGLKTMKQLISQRILLYIAILFTVGSRKEAYGQQMTFSGSQQMTFSGSGGNMGLPLLKFGNNRKFLPRDEPDVASEAISIPLGFPFGSTIQSLAYVGSNGIISFGRPFLLSEPQPFPSTTSGVRTANVIAPYWSDNDIRREGNVSYEVFEFQNTDTYGDEQLTLVSNYIMEEYDNSTNFVGVYMILAEWTAVHPFPHGSNVSLSSSVASFVTKINTYQAILITDLYESYAIFTYECGELQWSGLNAFPTIGFNSPSDGTFANHPLTAQEGATEIACRPSLGTNNVIYQISKDQSAVEEQKRTCLAWYLSDFDKYDAPMIDHYDQFTLPCPCTFFQAFFDRRFRFVFNPSKTSYCFAPRFLTSEVALRECCYSFDGLTFGALVTETEHGGSLLLSPVPDESLQQNNRIPQSLCCSTEVGLCDLYYERRPPNFCDEYIPVLFSVGFGDPHITTLDGFTYTFNGIGEYVLVRSMDDDIEFQGRTAEVGNSGATVFSAIAIGHNGITVQISWNAGFTVLVNGNDESDGVMTVNSTIQNSTYVLERIANNSILLSFPSGLTLTTNYTNSGILNFVLNFPPLLNGSTEGLLGTLNGNDSDDLVFRNGTLLPTTSSDAEKHSFGQSWQISQSESIFQYMMGENVFTFSQPDHMPPFLDELLANLAGNSTFTDVCGNNTECLFDFSQTGDEAVGMATMQFTEEVTERVTMSRSFPPTISAPEIFLATVGVASTYSFNVTGSVNVTVVINGQSTLPPNTNFTDAGDTFTLTWSPADISEEFNLIIIATAEQSARSTFIPHVQLCGCLNDGICTKDGVLNLEAPFVVLNCECPAAYDGNICENDADGCDAISCLAEQPCTDNPAPAAGAVCDCPDGYKEINSKCVDINECDNATTNNCTELQICINAPGSYSCSCRPGYRSSSTSSMLCEDVDECEEYNDCHQNCTNTDGSFDCACMDGFVLRADNRTCEVVGDAACPESNNCTQLCYINNTIQICTCERGYQIDSNGITCNDVDECSMTESPCSQDCSNTDGSFVCSCTNGYTLDSDGRACIDVNECLQIQTPCMEDRLCSNSIGGFECLCPPGTTLLGDDCLLEVVGESSVIITPSSTILPTTSTVISSVSPTVLTSSPLLTSPPENPSTTGDISVLTATANIVSTIISFSVVPTSTAVIMTSSISGTSQVTPTSFPPTTQIGSSNIITSTSLSASLSVTPSTIDDISMTTIMANNNSTITSFSITPTSTDSTMTSSISSTSQVTPTPLPTTLPFLPFSNQKQQLQNNLDGVSDEIYIPNGFPFGFQAHTVAYVGTNGVISFSRPFYYWYPSQFPGYSYLRRFYVIAPYWADHDIRREGDICYETFERGRSENDDNLLDRVDEFLQSRISPNFTGTFMILAEWRDVHPYPHGSNNSDYYELNYPSISQFLQQENTYQALVITDGSESYTIFTYMCDLMQWSGLWNYPTIGYNAAGTLFENHPLTGREEANQIDCDSNGNQYSNVVYKISADPDGIQQLQAQCLSWYYSDIESYGSSENISDFSKSQIACPCTSFQAWWDRRFRYFTRKDDSFCFIERFPNARGGAQECCYSTSSQMFGALVLQGRSSGGLLRYHPYWSWTVNYPNYDRYDRIAQERCCLSAVGYCRYYHERRPPHNCEGYVPQRRTWGWGDPHITTTDGRRYTFNGLGEYVLLRTNRSDFEFQGRTARAADSNATIFSAFALSESNDYIEIHFINESQSFSTILNGNNMSDSLTSVGDNVTTSSSFIERSSNNSITVSFPSGVGITINYTAGLLVYTLEVPSSFEGTTSGLLGNYNNDDSDEFVFRDGTMISNSSSDRDIHQFGQSWQVTQSESIFTYETGQSVDKFSFPDHAPPFLDEILSNLMGNSTLTDVCGNNVECLFDFSQTGNMEVGMAAISVENETATESQEAFSFPPNITAPETFMATVGEEYVYTFTVSSDSENINVIILHEGEETLPSGAQLNNPGGDSWTITWTPADSTSVLNLTIVAVDLNMNISSIFNPVVQLCACESGGTCTADGLPVNDLSFIILNCDCPEAYDGEFCQNDADGCEIVSCLEGQQCLDYAAPLVGAECACPVGYASDSDGKCADINECANRSTIDCTQQCINTPGSYECDCYDGYRAITANATQCEDINECEGYNDCHQICTNTEGSYYCSCNVGFVLEADNRTCTALVNCTMSNSCSDGCAVINATDICFCTPGYQLDVDSITCIDIDECTEDPCDHNCTNTDGSFTCSCNDGYELDENGRSCNDIDECLSGPCPSHTICNNNDGSYTCDCPDGTIMNGTDCVLIPTPTVPTASSVTPTATVGLGSGDDDGLTGGEIAGIVIGSTFAAIILLAIIVLIILWATRYRAKSITITPRLIMYKNTPDEIPERVEATPNVYSVVLTQTGEHVMENENVEDDAEEEEESTTKL